MAAWGIRSPDFAVRRDTSVGASGTYGFLTWVSLRVLWRTETIVHFASLPFTALVHGAALWLLAGSGVSETAPLENLEPQQGTLCLGCLPVPYELRVELTWKGPWDLDLYALLPRGEGAVFYSNQNLPGADRQSPGWLDHDHTSSPYPRVGERFVVTQPSFPESPDPAGRRYCLAVSFYRGETADRAELTLQIDYRKQVQYRCHGGVATRQNHSIEQFTALCSASRESPPSGFTAPILLVLPLPGEPFEAPQLGPGWDCELVS